MRRLALLGVLLATVFCIQLVFAASAGAADLTGGFSPTIVNGKADLNGNLAVGTADDSTAFYGDTDIIDGKLDCNNWVEPNDGTAGNGVITNTDDCTLIGYDGTANGVTIDVENGFFQVGNGPLPLVFNALDPDNGDIAASDFAWSAIGGKVDSNGNEMIDGDDCHFSIVGDVDILGNPGANECGFATAPDPADNGLIDLNGDIDITAADSCDHCFFRHEVVSGKVQELECPGHEGDPRPDVVGTPRDDVLRGTTGNNVICGFGGDDVLIGLAGKDLLIGGGGHDLARGGGGRDRLKGGRKSDVLLGGRGDDTLLGGRGNDFLNGGRGIDICIGGPGRDVRRRCELH
jgi:Ca2+-binding RTX toxin-like protein